MTHNPHGLSPGQKERRRFGRRKVFKNGLLQFSAPETDNSIECLVVDISAGGARVRPTHAIDGLPQILILHILDDDMAFKCRVVYWLDGHAGLEFTAGPWRPSWNKQDRSDFEHHILQKAITNS